MKFLLPQRPTKSPPEVMSTSRENPCIKTDISFWCY